MPKALHSKAYVPATYYDEVAEAQAIKSAAHSVAIKSDIDLGKIAMIPFVIALVVTFEAVMGFTAFNWVFGAEVDDAPVPFTVWVLSASALMALTAFHIAMIKTPEHPAIRLIERIAPWALAFFILAMVGLFAQIEFVAPSAEDVSIPISDDELFGEGDGLVEAEDSSLWDGLFNMLIGLGLGGVLIFNLVTLHRLIDYVRERLPALLIRRQQARSALREAKAFLDMPKRLLATRREIARRKAMTPADKALDAASDVEAAIAPTLRKLNELTVDGSANAANSPSGLLARFTAKPNRLPGSPPASDIKAFIDRAEARLAKLPDDLGDMFK